MHSALENGMGSARRTDVFMQLFAEEKGWDFGERSEGGYETFGWISMSFFCMAYLTRLTVSWIFSFFMIFVR